MSARVGIQEVARLAGVSTATVSRALSGRGQVSADARARVHAAAERLGYVVSASASSLASGRTRNIGVLTPFLDRWFFGTVLSGLSAGLMRHGYDLTLYAVTTDPAERRAVFETFVRRRRVDGVVAISLKLDEDETARLRELAIPVIAVGGPNPDLTTLTVDDHAIGATAAAHLLGLGHRRIGHIGASPEFDVEFRIPTQRRQGFERTLSDARAPVVPELFAPADFTVAGGAAAALRLLRQPDPPTAVFAASDEMAIGAILAARDSGLRVPEDLSVIGVDGHELGGFFALTTIDQHPRRQGERAAETILRGFAPDAAPPAPAAELPFELVIRGTTAPPPAARG